MWPLECVAILICCDKSKESSRAVKFFVSEWDKLSTWILKSPVMTSLPDSNIRLARNEVNSYRNWLKVYPFFLDGGGLYTRTSRNNEDSCATLMWRHSKDLKRGVSTGVTLRGLL